MAECSIRVEVACALPDRQILLCLDVAPETTVRSVVMNSPLVAQVPELDLANCALGIFGKQVDDAESRRVQDGDRVEVYRPLLADPKDVRKRRAAQAAAKSAGG